MKSLKLFVMLVMAFATISLFSGCAGDAASDKTSKTVSGKNKAGPEYTSAYICPMHCKGSGNKRAGTCPVCKMDYVVNKDAPKKQGGHNHDHGHSHHGHNHDHHGHNHDHGHGHDGHNHDHGHNHDGHNH